MKKLLLILLIIPIQVSAIGFDSGFGYCQEWTINSSQISTTTPAFPVLATTTKESFKSTGNGGKIETDDAFDFIITDGTDCGTDSGSLLDFEREFHSTTTGEVVYWVQTPISSTTDETMLAYYGKSGASDQATTTGVWDADLDGDGNQDYVLVNHCKDPASGGNSYDSTSNDNDATVEGDGVADTPGQIENSYSLAGSNDYLAVSSPTNINFTNGFTLEIWNKPTVATGDGRTIHRYFSAGGKGYYLTQFPTGTYGPSWGFGVFAGTNGLVTTKNDLGSPSGDWQYVVGRRDSDDNIRIFVDGVKDSDTDTAVGTISAGTQVLRVGTDHNLLHDYTGSFDEIRMSNIAWSDEWISTTNNNHSDVGTFLTFGAEETAPEEEVNKQDIIWWD